MEDENSLSDSFLPEGTLLGSFEIKGVLGRGGFGISYWAIDQQLGREVVLKEHYPLGLCKREDESAEVIPSSPLQEHDYNHSLDSFCKEARIIAALDHPGIVRIHDIFQALGTAYIVMAFVEGCTLEQWLEKHAEDYDRVQKLFVALLDVLSYLHSQEVFHRDIKPSNIMVKEDDTPVLLDFGAALHQLPVETMTLMASPVYSPPEQYMGHGDIGPWSDLFALGRSFIVVLKDKLDLYPKLFSESLKKATRMDIEYRFQSADEWKSYLKNSVCGSSSHWMLWVMGGAIFILSFVWILVGEKKGSDKDYPPIIEKEIEGTSRLAADVSVPDKTQDSPPVNSMVTSQKVDSYPRNDQYASPNAPLFLTGTRLILSSESFVSTFRELDIESNDSIAQQLLLYQKFADWNQEKLGFRRRGGQEEMRFITSSVWGHTKGKVDGSYAYKKMSKDKGVIVFQYKKDPPDEPKTYLLLHFTSPDSGMAVLTATGTKKVTGNIAFRLLLLPSGLGQENASDVIASPELSFEDDMEQLTLAPPISIIGQTFQFRTDSIQCRQEAGKTDHLSANKKQAFIEDKLMTSLNLKDWKDGGTFPLKGDVCFLTPYMCEYQHHPAGYIYRAIDDKMAFIELSDLQGKKGESYFLLQFTDRKKGTANYYDGENMIFRNIEFNLLNASESGADKGIRPQIFFEQFLEKPE